MLKKTLIFLLVSMIALAVLVSCKPKEAASVKQGQVITLKYADWEKFDTKFIDEWNKTHPNIQVEFIPIPDNGEKMTKVDILAMSGDIDIMPMSDAEQFIRMQNGVLSPLTKYLEQDKIDMKNIYGAFEDWSKHQNVYYCMPLRTSLQVVYYNRDMFDAAKEAYPDDNWTWDQYIEKAKRLTKGEGQNKIYGTYTHTFGGDWATVATQGASFYTADEKSNIKAPAFVKGLNVRKDMDGKYQMPFSQITAVKTMPNSEFFGGKAAMAMAGSWMVRDMKNKEKFPFSFRVGVAYIPRYDASMPGKRISMSCSALGIPANSKYKDEAWQFIKYYITQCSSTVASSGNIPCYQPAWNDDLVTIFLTNSGLPLEEGRKFFDKSATVTTNKVVGPAAAMYNQIINEQTPLFFNGEKSLDTVLNDIETRANAEIAKEKK